jgi:omega-6 fatty acid desaturase (delta-12 desaturase)
MRCEAFYEKGFTKPLARFVIFAALYALSVFAIVQVHSIWVTVAGATVAAICACRVFVIAHDACHGSFTRSRVINAVVGRLAFLPAWHNFSLWTYFHNGVHHQFTNLAGRDYVWVPLSWQDFSDLPRWRRLVERVFRHHSTLGFPAYYITRLWAPKLILPLAEMPRHVRLRGLLDLVLPLSFPALLTAVVFLAHFSDARLDALDLSFDLLGVVVVPFVVVSWAIGFVVYFNHTHPETSA